MATRIVGSGKSRHQLGLNANINVTPFVDVMLVLLIIFMVAAPMATVAIKLDAPPVDSRPPLDRRPVFVSIQDGGDVYVVASGSRQRATLSRLAGVLASGLSMNGDPKAQTVLIRADRHVRYNQFMQVVNQLKSDGYDKVSLISEDLN